MTNQNTTFRIKDLSHYKDIYVQTIYERLYFDKYDPNDDQLIHFLYHQYDCGKIDELDDMTILYTNQFLRECKLNLLI